MYSSLRENSWHYCVFTLYVRVFGHEHQTPAQSRSCGVSTSNKQICHRHHKILLMKIWVLLARFLSNEIHKMNSLYHIIRLKTLSKLQVLDWINSKTRNEGWPIQILCKLLIFICPLNILIITVKGIIEKLHTSSFCLRMRKESTNPLRSCEFRVSRSPLINFIICCLFCRILCIIIFLFFRNGPNHGNIL